MAVPLSEHLPGVRRSGMFSARILPPAALRETEAPRDGLWPTAAQMFCAGVPRWSVLPTWADSPCVCLEFAAVVSPWRQAGAFRCQHRDACCRRLVQAAASPHRHEHRVAVRHARRASGQVRSRVPVAPPRSGGAGLTGCPECRRGPPCAGAAPPTGQERRRWPAARPHRNRTGAGI
jgi:hypothetical protein